MTAPRCPVHDRAMMVEDRDSAYGQILWVCPVFDQGCREVGRTGPADSDIYRREDALSGPAHLGSCPAAAGDPWRQPSRDVAF